MELGLQGIFAGTAASSQATLQFLGSTSVTNSYSIGSVNAIAAYGTVAAGFRSDVTIQNGINALASHLTIQQATGSVLNINGNDVIDFNSVLDDASGGAQAGAAAVINGTLTVGAFGTNSLGLSGLAALGGTGTIRQVGQHDTTAVGNVGAGLDFDIRAGTLTIGSSFGTFRGTIGPANGNGAALGPLASITYDPAAFSAYEVQSATFDTSTGLLSFLNASNQTLYNPFHFRGDASGLNISVSGYVMTITDHPGAGSPIPIKFT